VNHNDTNKVIELLLLLSEVRDQAWR